MQHFWILLFIIQVTFSQSRFSDGKIEYDMILSLDGLSKYNGTVLFNSNYSLFKFKSAESENLYTEEVSLKGEYVINKIDTTASYVYMDKVKKETYEIQKSLLTKEIVAIKDDNPLINWKLIEENKLIGKYNCFKAEADFRGRNYTAWYCADLPYNVGPWKFNNLPGVIMELYDSESKVIFIINKITIPFEEEIKNIIEGFKVISSKQNKEDNQEFLDDLERKVNSKLSRDVKVTISNKRIISIEQ
ncbi:conserved hypothetical protein [Flavobacterium sp. 9AF]|uniref:GLPGLI family protein n=1 Tax=Flavobacterium sp. 9AF TaxID=2653142 RepID=UPI0012F32879|nr:GLPGLI family protein [Flavobacterium sp. 9AF]VXB14125.1 conserved hypothetical protein [Flavobacterium sp. 9AF]